MSIQIKEQDNVAVAVLDLATGTVLESGITTRESIPQAHKIALQDIAAGGEIIRYGVVLGYAKSDIPAGSWINEHMLEAFAKGAALAVSIFMLWKQNAEKE